MVFATTSLQIVLPPGRTLHCAARATMQQQHNRLHVERLLKRGLQAGSPVNAGLVAALVLPLLVLQLREPQPPGRAVRAPRHARLQALSGAQAEVVQEVTPQC